MNVISLMALPFLECLVLVGIHSYLGLHVIRRRVIFVDLALAQVAALGTTVGFLFGLNPHSRGAYIFSLLFTFVAAAVFSLTRLRRDRVPQEAVIGLAYALAASVGILVVFGAPHGAEHIQEISTGALLWVRADDVWRAAVAYTVVGVLHFVFRRPFREISEDPEGAYQRGRRVRAWDFLFYLLFGLVITHSVQTAGVLLVFVFLVVPAIIGVMLTERMGLQLLIGWAVGVAVSVGGLALSYYRDLPSGPTVVAVYGAALVLAAVAVYVARAARPIRALGLVGAGVVVAAALSLGTWGLGRWFSTVPSLAQADCPHHEPGSRPDHDGHGDHPHAREPSAARREPTAEALGASLARLDLVEKRAALARVGDTATLAQVARGSADPETRLATAERLLAVDRGTGARLLVGLLGEPAVPPLLRDEALRALRGAFGGDDIGVDPWTAPETPENRRGIEAWRARVGAR